MNIVEDKGEERRIELPFASCPRIGIAYLRARDPMLAALRDMVVLGRSGDAKWRGDFRVSRRLWKRRVQILSKRLST